MFWNNVKIALRNLRKNKVFAAINISGLAIGLTIYVFGGLLVDYEQTHDLFFENTPRIYTIGSTAAPDLNVGVDKMNSTFTAVAPIVEAELQDVDAVARTVNREYLLTMGAESFYQGVRFADPALLQMFDLQYLGGDESALQDPSGLLITESTAIRYFGKTDVLGKVVTFDNEHDYFISAVVEDVPLNSHFNSMLVADAPFQVVAPLAGLNRMRDWDLAGNWNNLSIGNMTYVMLPESLDGEWLQNQMNGIYDRHVPDDQKEVIADLTVDPLVYANLALWDMIGLPAVSVVALLSFLVLVVACVNYTNLATAQSLSRTREVGMRKTMGASQWQLLVQFLIESLVMPDGVIGVERHDTEDVLASNRIDPLVNRREHLGRGRFGLIDAAPPQEPPGACREHTQRAYPSHVSRTIVGLGRESRGRSMDGDDRWSTMISSLPARSASPRH